MNPEMTNSSSFPARLVASIAIVVGAIALIVVISASTDGGGSSSAHRSPHHRRHHAEKQQEHVPATYTVQSGDTLTEISQSVGVPVSRIERLNPEVDPQILIAGETLKLK
jgi:LysM repeat protein